MGEFFRGWRRKTGVMTLLMACVFMAGWVRSQAWIDEIYVPVQGGIVVYIASSMAEDLCFGWRIFTGESEWKAIQFQSTLMPVEGLMPGWPIPEREWRWDWAGFHLVTFSFPKYRSVEFSIPYWSIVIPLTLLSAFLLLSKPRKSNQMKVPELTTNEGK